MPDDRMQVLSTTGRLRNSLHANGIHHRQHPNEQSLVTIRGIVYELIDGQHVSCASWEHIAHALEESVGILEQVFLSPRVRERVDPCLSSMHGSRRLNHAFVVQQCVQLDGHASAALRLGRELTLAQDGPGYRHWPVLVAVGDQPDRFAGGGGVDLRVAVGRDRCPGPLGAVPRLATRLRRRRRCCLSPKDPSGCP